MQMVFKSCPPSPVMILLMKQTKDILLKVFNPVDICVRVPYRMVNLSGADRCDVIEVNPSNCLFPESLSSII